MTEQPQAPRPTQSNIVRWWQQAMTDEVKRWKGWIVHHAALSEREQAMVLLVTALFVLGLIVRLTRHYLMNSGG